MSNYEEKDFEFDLSYLVGKKTTYTLVRTAKNVAVAHKIYVELVTRKLALPYDEENDVLYEVYLSWFKAFQIIREQIGNIPYDDVNLTTGISGLNILVLNGKLREHLTKHSARFRKWYEIELKDSPLTPQEIQKHYPQYDDIIKEVKELNGGLADYANQLRRFILTNE